MHLTWFDSNSWLIELAGKRILLDPWFVGPLMFGNAAWFFKATHPNPRPIPDRLDLVLLSQGLEDHAHRPTLEQIDRAVPVLGSPSAAKVAEQLGFQTAIALDHGQTWVLGEQVAIRATTGSPTGPKTLENGYILRAIAGAESGESLYYEPHGYHPAELAELGPVDVTLCPLMDLSIGGFLPIIQGTDSALKLAKMLKPQVMLPTAAAGDVQYEGLLVSMLRAKGNTAELQGALGSAGLAAQVLEPKPGDRLAMPLVARALV